MKTNYLFRSVKFFTIYSMVFLCTALKINAQCPTLTPSPPSLPICNASGYNFANLSSDFAINNGGGIAWYSAAVGGIRYDSTGLVNSGMTYYADASSGSCDSRSPLTITFQVDPVPSGSSLDKFYCSNENPTIQDYIDDALASYIPSGVSVYYNPALTNPANPTDILATGIVNYYIVFNDATCTSQIKFGKSI